MKKKVALLLAAIMALSPVSAFAATDNSVEGTTTTVKSKTVLMESTYFNKNGAANGKDILELDTELLTGDKSSPDYSNDDVERVVSGSDLVIRARNGNIKAGDTFDLVLTNSKWYFASDESTAVPVAGPKANLLSGVPAPAAWPTGYVYTGWPVEGTTAGEYPNYFGPDAATTGGILDQLYYVSDNTKEFYPYFTSVFNVAFPTTAATDWIKSGVEGLVLKDGSQAKTDTETKDFASSALNYTQTQNGNAVNFTKSTFDRTKGTYSRHAGHAYLRFGSGTNATTSGAAVAVTDGEIPYMIRFNNGSDKTIGTLTVLADARTGVSNNDESKIVVPLVTILDGSGDAKVTIANSNNSRITAASYTFASVSGSGGKTTTTVDEVKTARNTFELGTIMIKEDVIGTIRSGIFYLTAPYGYTFADPEKAIKDGSKEKYVELSTLGGLKFNDGTTVGLSVIQNNDSYDGFRNPVTYDYDKNNEEYRDKLRIDLSGKNYGTAADPDKAFGITNQAFSSVAGTIYIKNLILLAEDYAPFDKDVELKLTIDKENDPKITPQSFKVAVRKDWIIQLEAVDPIPTLVNGRLAGSFDGAAFNKSRADDFDGWHQTAKVIFKENVVASWWEERDTELTLPDGVKFIEVEIDEAKDTVYDFGKKTYVLNDTYNAVENKGLRQGYVKVSGNKVTLTDLSLKAGKKGYFEMDSWVSIESGFEGDVTLAAGGTGVPYEVAPVVIAKAVSPITIDTQVTDVKIGYQWQKVADFTLNETGAGRLLKDKTLRLSIDDAITVDDIYFAPDSVIEKSGNISFTKPSVNQGRIELTIDRASNETASAIKFTNVYVKVDRTVPESNNHPYKILAEGPAIAANYVGVAKNGSTNYAAYEPVFSTKGIGADYLNVITSATDKPGVLSNTVKVTIGSDVVLVGRDNPVEIQMDTAAYISADSNSTMVPVRFVSVALGIPDGQIVWDDENRTVTINYTNTTVQMKAGSDQITINGVTTTMYSPDVPPKKVTVEMKDNRAFLPFRQLGYALGVPVAWDAATNTAIYNSPEDLASTSTNAE